MPLKQSLTCALTALALAVPVAQAQTPEPPNDTDQSETITQAPNSAQPDQVEVQSKLPQESPDDPKRNEVWERTFKQGSQALTNSEYGSAERLLRTAVAESAGFGEKDPRYARSLGQYAKLLRIRGRFAEAEPAMEEEFRSLDSAANGDTGKVMQPMADLISFYLDYGTASKAQALAERLLQFLTGKIEDYRAPEKQSYKAGQPLTGWAGSAAKNMTTPVVEWAIAADAVGVKFKQHQNYDMAEKLFNAALDVKETVLGKEHLSLANSFDNLADLFSASNDDRRAEQYFGYALETTERILPSSNYQVFNRLDKLAKCYIKQNKYEEAEKLYLRSLNFWKDEPSNNGSEARAAYSLGNVYMLQKKYDLAAPMLKSALEQAENLWGSESATLAPYLNKYSDCLYYLGGPTASDAYKDEYKQIKIRAANIQNPL